MHESNGRRPDRQPAARGLYFAGFTAVGPAIRIAST
jgi:hypothetical protein